MASWRVWSPLPQGAETWNVAVPQRPALLEVLCPLATAGSGWMVHLHHFLSAQHSRQIGNCPKTMRSARGSSPGTVPHSVLSTSSTHSPASCRGRPVDLYASVKSRVGSSAYMYTYLYMMWHQCVRVHETIYACTITCVHVNMYVCMYVRMCVCVRVCVCMCACILNVCSIYLCIYMCVHARAGVCA